ncbi:deoxynucleotidyltransferase terminal-interacting protein 2 [Eleutherodactylus coqui]|uniref:deoxynucleotidyltransferase terminal-interacting protein 2 n=1 Tax=Eleutherodactylus coqui TaxID=57060 RepID=UPI003461A566
MVATRRGTRVEPQEEGETRAAEPTPEKVISSPSLTRTRRSAIIHGQTGENGTNESKSAVASRSPPAIHGTQITTRSRHKSGQSDVSEAESTASSTLRRRSCNTQSLEQLPDSTRELRSRRIVLITEPIVESKDDAELSDAQSNCSSVAITPRKRQSETTTRSVPTRSQSSLLVSELTFDVTGAESNSTLVPGVRSIATRSTRSSRARRPSSLVREPEQDQTSDAESCSSGISIQPLAKRSSRRNKSNLQSDEVVLVNESNKDDYSEQETSKKQSPKRHVVKSGAQSLVGEQNVLSSCRRSLRSRSAIKKDVISDDEPESSGTINKVLDLEEAEVQENSVTKDADVPVEASTVPAVQSSETRPEENIIADQVLQPSEDEEAAVEKSIAANDEDATEETNQSVQRSANMPGSPNICLVIDSSDSEGSQRRENKGDGLFVINKAAGVDASKKYILEHETDDKNYAGEKRETIMLDEDEEEDDDIIEIEEEVVDKDEEGEKGASSGSDDEEEDETNIEVKGDDDNELVEKCKSKKATKQLQGVSGDGLFVIDKSPGVDSSKKYFLEPEYEGDEVDEKGESSRSDKDDDEEHENGMEVEEKNGNEQVVDKHKFKKASNQQRHNVSGDGVFVIDKVPGVDSRKKYFQEPEDEDDEADDKGDSSGSDEDDDEEHENRMEVEEEDDDEQVVDKHKFKKASKQQLQDVSGDGLFVIDKDAGLDSSKKYFLEPEDEVDEEEETPELDEDDDDFIDEDEPEDEEETLINRPKKGFALSTSIDTGINLKQMGGLYINFDAGKPNPGPSLLSKMKKESKKKDELLQKSVITPDFEKKESVPPYLESRNQLKKFRKEQRDKTSGRGWFEMKAPELTDELKNDLKALKMRSAMDPKHFYKKNDRQGFPKYFEVGTVVDNPIDYYHSRIPKKERKRTMVDELLADSELRRYNKKKFKEIMAEKAARAEGKKNKKKKKFRT